METHRRSENVNRLERTLIVIKPDGMKQVGKIISYYKKAGLKIIAEKTMHVTGEMAEKHYPASEQQILGMGSKTIQAMKDGGMQDKVKKMFGTENAREIGMKLRGWLIEFITSAPVKAFVLEGENAVTLTRKVTGFTDPARADKGTVRGDFGTDAIIRANAAGRPVMNLVHASGTVEEAEKEIALWFSELKR